MHRPPRPDQPSNARFVRAALALAIVALAACGGTAPAPTVIGDDAAGTAATTAAADHWYFRGTPNGWGTTEMTEVGTSGVFVTCQTFDASGAAGAPRFKVDHYADWRESYPARDLEVGGHGSFTITFDRATHTPTFTRVASCTTPPTTMTLTLCALKPSSWTTVNVHSWAAQPTGVLADTVWPGPSMTDRGGGWYCRDFAGVTSINVVFSSAGRPQTADLSRRASGCYDIAASTWSDTCAPLGGTTNPPPTTTPPPTNPPPTNPPPPSGTDFREESIYFVMTTRFFDGDPTNNYYNRDRITPGDPHWRGDFAGLIQQLPYIQDLGFTAIWITPPIENRSGLDYHGYHGYDWTRVDPRLESPGATYQDLIDAVHARGMKIVQDVVINHSSNYGIRGQVWIDHLPIKYFVPAGSQQGRINNGAYQGNLGDYRSAFRDDNDNPLAPQWFRDRHGSDAAGLVPLVDPLTGATVPSPGYNPNRFFGVDAQRLDPNWYHQNGFIAGGDWESPGALVSKHIAGDAIDLATERQNVRDYLNGAIDRYLDMGVDAIRLDTVKHVERSDLLSYVNAWKAHKPGLFVFGENLVKGTGFGSELTNDNASAVIRPWWYTRLGNDPANPTSGGNSGFSVLDFSLFSTFRDNVTRGGFGQIGYVLSMDWIYGDATQLVTFFQNHDVGPDNDFKYRFGGDDWKAAMAYSLLWTIRGIPCLYQGEEIKFQAGAPEDIAGGNDTLAQTGRAYYGDNLLPQNLPRTQSHPLYRHVRRLNQIRRAIPALQKAPMSQVNEWGSGMSFVRNWDNGRSVAVVGLAADSRQTITVGGVPNGTYRDAVTGGTITTANGTLTFDVAATSAGIWVLNGPGKIGEDGPFLR